MAFSTPRERVFIVSIYKVHFNKVDHISYKINIISKWVLISNNYKSTNNKANKIIKASLNKVDNNYSGLYKLV